MEQGSPEQSHPELRTTSRVSILGHCPKVTKPLQKPDWDQDATRAPLWHRCAPATSPLRTKMHPSAKPPPGSLGPCTTHLQSGQRTLTVANSLNMFSRGQAQQLRACVAYHISGGGISTLLPRHRSGRRLCKHPGAGRMLSQPRTPAKTNKFFTLTSDSRL